MAKKYSKYALAGGTVVPGVTSILGCIAKPALYNWYAKEGKNAQVKLEEAGEFGSKVHTLIEAIYHGQKPQLDAKLTKITENFQSVIEPLVQDWLWFERKLISEKYGYGGTADLAFIDKEGKRVLADIKTSSGVWPEMNLQLAAYEQALAEEGEKYDYKIIFHLDKETLVWEVVHIETEGLLDVFLAALRIWTWKAGK